MTVAEIIASRQIKEVLHFTTNKGVTGMLATECLLSRKRLPIEKHLEHIYEYNCADRSRDAEWHDHVNLSITTVNRRLFGISKGNWHAGMDGWWCILSFSPEILSHGGVYFTTTNNMYSGVKRFQGAAGLEKLFGARIVRWDGNVVTRDAACPPNQPTCEQAEVLYPGQVSLKFLQKLYVPDAHSAAALESQLELYSLQIEVTERPELF